MTIEQINDIAFRIIAEAGDSVSDSMEVIELAEKSEFEKAKQLLIKANESLTSSHKIHSELLFNFANGQVIESNILLVHAQDHMTKAEVMVTFAEKFIKLYETITKTN